MDMQVVTLVAFGLLVELGIAAAIVLFARSRRSKCKWPIDVATRKFNWCIAAVIAIQVGGYVAIAFDSSIGIVSALQWFCIYFAALAFYRKRDLQMRDLPFS
jgi:hypothetical protein